MAFFLFFVKGCGCSTQRVSKLPHQSNGTDCLYKAHMFITSDRGEIKMVLLTQRHQTRETKVSNESEMTCHASSIWCLRKKGDVFRRWLFILSVNLQVCGVFSQLWPHLTAFFFFFFSFIFALQICRFQIKDRCFFILVILSIIKLLN